MYLLAGNSPATKKKMLLSLRKAIFHGHICGPDIQHFALGHLNWGTEGRQSEKPSKEESIKNRLYSSSINRLVKVIANIQHDDDTPIHLKNESIQLIYHHLSFILVFTMQIFVKTLTGKTITLEVERYKYYEIAYFLTKQ